MAHTIVIFGASGDLTSRKLIPALYVLHRKKRLPPDTRIVGFSRTPMSHEEWRTKLAATTKEFAAEEFAVLVGDRPLRGAIEQRLVEGTFERTCRAQQRGRRQRQA